jgi:predicted ATPase
MALTDLIRRVSMPPVIKTLKLANILSFGSVPEEIQLGPLNVLIGPNGSGKSNLVEIIALLQSAPTELSTAGGVHDWLWKGPWAGEGAPRAQWSPPLAAVEAVLEYPQGKMPLRYFLQFTELGQRLNVVDERIENEKPDRGEDKCYFYFGYENGRPMLNTVESTRRQLRREDIDPMRSILSQRKDSDQYPELSFVGESFAAVQVFRSPSFGRQAPARVPQPADQRNDRLEESGENLGLVLNRLRREPAVKARIIEYLREFYPDLRDVDVAVEGGTAQVFLEERGWTLPATRMSDGTLRWLCLLAALTDRNHPVAAGGTVAHRLICVEEPELGLHPDIMPTLAKLLHEASEHSQLIVTTHSEALVDALSDTPEVVIVCEKEGGATRLKRLDGAALSTWLEKFTLGDLWRKGEIGGNRW